MDIEIRPVNPSFVAALCNRAHSRGELTREIRQRQRDKLFL